MLTIDQTIDPENCANMAEVREGVDAIDGAIVKLIARRFAYMDAAARIKNDRQSVRDEGRKAQVLENVRTAAGNNGISPELVEELWDRLVEASIAYEFDVWDRLNAVS